MYFVQLSVLEEACKRFGVGDKSGFALQHGKNMVDLSVPLRLSSVPQNAVVDLVLYNAGGSGSAGGVSAAGSGSAASPGAGMLAGGGGGADVRIALQTMQGGRGQGNFAASTTLASLVESLGPSAGIPASILSDASILDTVSVVYMRSQVKGASALQSTTLASMGLIKGSAALRVSWDSPAAAPTATATEVLAVTTQSDSAVAMSPTTADAAMTSPSAAAGGPPTNVNQAYIDSTVSTPMEQDNDDANGADGSPASVSASEQGDNNIAAPEVAAAAHASNSAPGAMAVDQEGSSPSANYNSSPTLAEAQSAVTASSSSVITSTSAPAVGGIRRVRELLKKLREEAWDTEASRCLVTMTKIFDNVITRPGDTAVRRLRLANPKFHENVGQFMSAVRVLRAAGFRKAGPDGWEDSDMEEQEGSSGGSSSGSSAAAFDQELSALTGGERCLLLTSATEDLDHIFHIRELMASEALVLGATAGTGAQQIGPAPKVSAVKAEIKKQQEMQKAAVAAFDPFKPVMMRVGDGGAIDSTKNLQTTVGGGGASMSAGSHGRQLSGGGHVISAEASSSSSSSNGAASKIGSGSASAAGGARPSPTNSQQQEAQREPPLLVPPSAAMATQVPEVNPRAGYPSCGPMQFLTDTERKVVSLQRKQADAQKMHKPVDRAVRVTMPPPAYPVSPSVSGSASAATGGLEGSGSSSSSSAAGRIDPRRFTAEEASGRSMSSSGLNDNNGDDVLTSDDHRMMMEYARKKTMELQQKDDPGFKTQAQKDLESLSKAKVFTASLIRVQFPDRTIIQGYFSPLEPVAHIHNWIRSLLSEDYADAPFYLYTTPPPKVIQENTTSTLQDEKLLPAVLMYFGWGVHPTQAASAAAAPSASARQQAASPVVDNVARAKAFQAASGSLLFPPFEVDRYLSAQAMQIANSDNSHVIPTGIDLASIDSSMNSRNNTGSAAGTAGVSSSTASRGAGGSSAVAPPALTEEELDAMAAQLLRPGVHSSVLGRGAAGTSGAGSSHNSASSNAAAAALAKKFFGKK